MARILPGGRLIGLDRDEQALQEAARTLSSFGDAVTLVHSRFDQIGKVLDRHFVEQIDGMLMDLGVSSLQFDRGERGFSLSKPGPADMRMDASGGQTAADLLATASEDELTDIFYRYGEERWSRRIARRIVEERSRRPITLTNELADVVARAIPRGAWPKGIHPATRIFMAIRIAVNDELIQIEPAIRAGVDRLKQQCRIGVISFHSLEDRIVKQTFRDLAGACKCPPGLPVCACGAVASVRVVSRRPIGPSEGELKLNPRARSAKLRVAERL